jgi:cobalt/nickel transport system permease protein
MGAGHSHPLHVHGHSPLHRAAPQVKVLGAVLFVFAVAVTPRTAVWAFAVDAALVVTAIRVARLPWRFVLSRALVVLPFVLFALLIPFIASGDRIDVLGVSVSREGLWGSFNVLAKATIGVTTSIVLAGTTEIPRILEGLGRLKVPPVLTAIAGFMLRYLEVVTGELRRMRTSMTARGYDPRWLWQARPVAAAAGALFVRSYERGERVHQAMVARGYGGAMPRLHEDAATPRQWIVAATPALVAATAALAAWMVSR